MKYNIANKYQIINFAAIIIMICYFNNIPELTR
jgi:hypothetical protein